MNDGSGSPEKANSPEFMLTQRKAHSMSGADADPGGIRWAQRETSPASLNSMSPTNPGDTGPSGVDKIFTQHVDFL